MPNNNSYKIPSYIDSSGNFPNIDSQLLEHLTNVLESSKAFLRSNRTWNVAEICRKILYGDDKTFNSLSRDFKVEINKLRRQGREIIGNAANIRPNFSIRTPKSDNSASDKAATYEELKDHWWYDRYIDRTFKEAIQEAASGIGYLFVWPKKDPNTRKWEIAAEAKSYKEVLPYQLPANGNLDEAESVIIHCEMPFAQFCETFPSFANKVKPDRNAPSYIGKRFEKARQAYQGAINIIKNKFKEKTDSVIDPSFPTKDVFYTFTRDNTINETDKPILMGTLSGGDLGGHDSYIVPNYQVGVNSKEDCRLFPNRRLTIWTNNLILSDGAPKWLSDCVPVAEFRFERLPKEYLGVPILNDGRSLEAAINQMINSIITRIKAKADFPIAIDEGSLGNNKNLIARLEKYGLKALVGKGVKLNFRTAQNPIRALFEKDLFDVDQKEFEIIKSFYELQDYVTGTNDYSNLQRKNQVPAADTQEALIQSLGVLSVDQEREISLGVHKFGRIFLQFAPQVYTLKKRITIIGANAVDLKDLDYDPESLIPSLDPKAENKPYWKRLREHLEKFNLFAAPGSLQERQSTTNKLTLLTLQKSGLAISDKELYTTFRNDGRYEEIKEEWKLEQIEKAKLAAIIRKEVEAIAGSGNSPEGGGLLQQVMQQLQQQNTQGEGRTPNLDTLPRGETKTNPDGTSRMTSATYGK